MPIGGCAGDESSTSERRISSRRGLAREWWRWRDRAARFGTLNNTAVDRQEHRRAAPQANPDTRSLIWGNGQGEVLTIVDIDGVRVGSLICRTTPLARRRCTWGIDVLLAPTWDNSDEWVPLFGASRGQISWWRQPARGSDVPRGRGADDIYSGDDDRMSKNA